MKLCLLIFHGYLFSMDFLLDLFSFMSLLSQLISCSISRVILVKKIDSCAFLTSQDDLSR